MKFLDDFEGFYKASSRGWADRYHTHWITKDNPEGYCQSLWRLDNVLELVCARSTWHLEKEGAPVWSSWVDEDCAGHYDTLEEAKIAAEKKVAKGVRKMIARLQVATKDDRQAIRTLRGISEKYTTPEKEL